MALKYVQTLTLYQAGAGNIIGATSVVLTTLTDIYGNAITSMTSFGAKGYITLEPDTTNEEGATFTGITVNANGTTTLTGVSTILAQSPYTETSGLVRQHAGGSKVVVTDNVAFWNTFGQTQNANEWAGVQTFDVPAVQATDPTSSSQVANKHYVDNVAVAGAPNASPTVKGIVQEATQAQVLAKTAAGSTGAELYINPATLPSTLVSDYKADTGAANAYAIAPVPAITAYVIGQVFSFKATNANTTASTLNVNALGTKAIVNSKGGALVANDILANMLVTVEYDGTSMVMRNPVANTPTIAQTLKFGGTGADGALAVSSGTTTIDLGSAQVVTKNYTSISITGTGAVNFINPATTGTLVILKSQGAVTLTSSATPMLDFSGLGAVGGIAGVEGVAGGSGSTMDTFFTISTNGSGGGGGGVQASTGTTSPSAGGSQITNSAFYTRSGAALVWRTYRLWVGGGGGGSGANTSVANVNGSVGGRGGGAAFIECGGAWNFTTASGVSVSGINGTIGTAGSGIKPGTGGGGGGGCGSLLVLYNTLTANSGTVTATGGNGGNGGAAGGSANSTSGSGAGAGAGGYGGAGGAGGGQSVNSVGGTGGAGGGAGAGGGGGGGGGGNGLAGGTGGAGQTDSSAAVITQNLFFN